MTSGQQVLNSEELVKSISKLFFPEGKTVDHTVGLELEIWPFRDAPDCPNQLVRFYDENGTGLIQLLEGMVGSIPGLEWAPLDNGMARFKIGDGGWLTFEPGGQLEYSGPPKNSLDEAIQDITGVIESLRCALKSHRIWFFHSGLNPWHSVDEVGLLLQKPRYQNMNNFFKAVGPYGQKMMRLSTSLQVNLDAGDPETAQRRWLAANLLGPVFTAMFSNSPFVDGKPTGAHSFRSIIWQNLDPSRAGFQKDFLAPEYQPCPVQQYLNFALDAYCLWLPDGKGGMAFDGRFMSFRDWMNKGSHGLFPTMEDWNTHLTTLFPEVRARGFFEVRYLDAQSKVWCAIPGILLTHLLYNKEAREEVIRLLAPYRTTLPGMLKEAATKGMTETEIGGLAKKIFHVGLNTATASEDMVVQLCERFFQHYTYRNRSPANDLIDLNNGEVFTPAQYRDFEQGQIDAAGSLLEMICEYR